MFDVVDIGEAFINLIPVNTGDTRYPVNQAFLATITPTTLSVKRIWVQIQLFIEKVGEDDYGDFLRTC